jgi:DNA polymerase III epsilon subunit-like protein
VEPNVAGYRPRAVARRAVRRVSAVADGLGLPTHRSHSAEGDALTTAQAFLALATHLEGTGRGSVRALAGAGWKVRAWGLWHGDGRDRA